MKSTDTRLIRLIASFKLIKALLLIVVGVGALKLIHTDISIFMERLVTRFGLDPGSRYVGHLILTAARLPQPGSGILPSAVLFTRDCF